MSPQHRLDLKIPPLVLVMITAVLMFIAAQNLPDLSLNSSLRLLIFVLLLGLSLLIMAAAAASFRQAKTTLDPRYPEKSQQLVQSGVFAYSRNPIYVAMLLALIAWGILLDNGFSLALCPLFIFYMNRFQIQIEEAHLADKFGPSFTSYCNTVRRWI
ncbi:isoprenylcysteine carboxylmethyltransferase family protein [Alginatibacterium sediminis]|uniref:Isoprenylcysteine carboxylmethyltransferase family protein n=1 Tax=Alginatibacterium sediminis TaxID=2164068 RepID=A0A420ECX1_9ALTE|nr:isoprenylcysteine carboxylmethyltransferase family protein [Alginatibacterium sediminis]RKF18518.1 isoprenylcysteine carboxylmethyltransferase family protein [Alginatibacterium sediminis]